MSAEIVGEMGLPSYFIIVSKIAEKCKGFAKIYLFFSAKYLQKFPFRGCFSVIRKKIAMRGDSGKFFEGFLLTRGMEMLYNILCIVK